MSGSSQASNEAEKVKATFALMDQRSYAKALDLAREFVDPSLRAAVLIDAGFGAKRSGSIRDGVELLEGMLANRQGLQSAGELPSLLYNVANGYYAIYQLRRRRRKLTVPPNDIELRLAKARYREAIDSHHIEPGQFRSQLFTNYANCLSQFGRGLESIEFYKRALDEDPQNGVASGNAGRELFSIARITGAYFHDYIDLAREYLMRSLSDKMHLEYGPIEVRDSYSESLKSIEEIIEGHEDFYGEVSSAGEPEVSQEAKKYLAFCRHESLLLNAWVGETDRAPANTDQISFGPIVTELEDERTVPELIRILNEIKEAYATARYLLFSASSGDTFLDEISRATLYFQADKVDLNGLRIGLCKSSYTRAFDVLDKVARLINVYFDIGRRQDHFWYVFAKRQSMGQQKAIRFVAPPGIVELDNYGLFALSDICIDYFESQHVDLKTIDLRRNLISHDYMAVVTDPGSGELKPNEIGAHSLFGETLQVMRLAKLAILYAMMSISLAEQQKPKGRTLPRLYGHHHGSKRDEIPEL